MLMCVIVSRLGLFWGWDLGLRWFGFWWFYLYYFFSFLFFYIITSCCVVGWCGC